MASLVFSTAFETFHQRKRNCSANVGFYMVDVFPIGAWRLHVNSSHALRRKKLEVQNQLRCLGSFIRIGGNLSTVSMFTVLSPSMFCQKPTSFIRFEGTKMYVLDSGSGFLSAVELANQSGGESCMEPGFDMGKSINEDEHFHLKRLENSIVKRNEKGKTTKQFSTSLRSVKRISSEPISKKGNKSKYVRGDYAAHNSNLSSIGTQASVDRCNHILKELEQSCDEKALSFFYWMKKHGKLRGNNTAYNLAFRVLSRNEDWKTLEMLLEEMASDPECELNSQVFNSVIFVCAKRGLIRRGTQWFRLMLEKGVRPSVATFGMLMGLYRKGGDLSEAEFAFEKMRFFKLQSAAAYSSMITIYTRLGLYHKSEETIDLMEVDGVTPNFENLLVRLNTYCQQGKFEEAELVFKSIQYSKLPINVVVYNTLITGYGKVGNIKAAEQLFCSLQSVGLKPDEVTYRSMVECFGRADIYMQAKQYYDELKHSGFYPNSSNFYTMINLQARHGDESGVIQTLMDMKAMGCQLSSLLGTLIQAYERVEGVERVLQILKSCSFYGDILLDASSCSILAVAFVRNFLLDSALQILQEKRWKDNSFEKHLCHTLICSCKEANRYEDAIRIFTQMPKLKTNLNLHVACSMIDIYSCMNRFNDAEDLYLNLKSSGVKLDMIAYSIIVRMYIRSGSLKDACLVLDMMEKCKEIEPDVYLYRDMLRIYQKSSMHEKLANTYYKILKRGELWDEDMYNCVINCCGHALPVDEMSRLFEEMFKRGYAANTFTINVMLDIYGKSGLFKKAEKVFQMSRKVGLVDAISYNTLIAAYGQYKEFGRMRYVVQQMQYAGYPVSLEAYNSMLDAYGKEDWLEEFNEVLEKMREGKCTSDHYTYNIMINIYGKKGWIEEVSHVLMELRKHGLEPDLYSFNTLIKAYGVAGMVEEAVGVVKEMRTKGIQPDKITFCNLIAALQRNENYLEAVKWSLWLKQMEQTV